MCGASRQNHRWDEAKAAGNIVLFPVITIFNIFYPDNLYLWCVVIVETNFTPYENIIRIVLDIWPESKAFNWKIHQIER